MEETDQLLVDIAAVRRQIARAYAEELCNRVEPGRLQRLASAIRSLDADLQCFQQRIGLGIIA